MTETAVPAAPPKPPNNWVGAGLAALVVALAWVIVSTGSRLAVFAFVMAGWVLAVMAHEFAHAAVGYLAGDRTVKAKGYLSLDPRRYGDLGVSLVIPLIALALGGVGFPGGAVYLRNDLMRGRLWRSAAALAGPAATFVVLLLIATALSFWAGWGVSGRGPLTLFAALTMLGFLQAMALILNLLPIPGLDGFNVIRPWLPAEWIGSLRKVEGLVMVGMLLAIFYVPGASRALFDASATVSVSLGLDFDALRAGWNAFHFWR